MPDERTAASDASDDPSPWVVRFASTIDTGGSVLDVAAGRGRHARWLEARGHCVTAIDRDAGALSVSNASETIACDLETDGAPWPVEGRAFDAVVVVRYLHRPLFPRLVASLAAGGVLIYETFAIGNERFGRPSDPRFLLEPGELLVRCAGLDVIAFEDGLIDAPRPASIQRICAVRRCDATGEHHGDGPVSAAPIRRHALSPEPRSASIDSVRIAGSP